MIIEVTPRPCPCLAPRNLDGQSQEPVCTAVGAQVWPEGLEIVTSVFCSVVHLVSFWKKVFFGVITTVSFPWASEPPQSSHPAHPVPAAWPESPGS